ncbi:hypothetical protein BST61_g2707 [Cercospora zeina]
MQTERPTFGPVETEAIFRQKWLFKLNAFTTESVNSGPPNIGTRNITTLPPHVLKGAKLIVDFHKQNREENFETCDPSTETKRKDLERGIAGIQRAVEMFLQLLRLDAKRHKFPQQVLDDMLEVDNFIIVAAVEGLWNMELSEEIEDDVRMLKEMGPEERKRLVEYSKEELRRSRGPG